MGWTKTAEIINGRLAMMSFMTMMIVYLMTGQLIPGVL